MGKIYAVGIGPGSEKMMTPQCLKALDEADVIVGYPVYLDLLPQKLKGKKLLGTPMRREKERCRMAIDEAAAGKIVAVVSSGDAGVYGMAGPLLEMAEEYPDVETHSLLVDAAAMFMVKDPARFQVVVTSNLFGDILTDLGAAIAGGMGLAAGAGFYEGVIMALLLIVLLLNVMSPLEFAFKRRLRNITLNVEFHSVEDIGTITSAIEAEGATVYDIDVERTERKDEKYPSAIFILQLSRDNHSHSGMLTSVAELGCVHSVQELIS